MLCKCLQKSKTLEWVVEYNRKYDDYIVTYDFYILQLYSTPNGMKSVLSDFTAQI